VEDYVLANDYVGDAFECDDEAGRRFFDHFAAAIRVDMGTPWCMTLSQLDTSCRPTRISEA